MRVFLFFLIISAPAFAMTNHHEAESFERLAEIATTLNDEVEAAGTVDCDSTPLSMREPEIARMSTQVERSERTLRVGYLSTCQNNRTIRNNVWKNVMTVVPFLCVRPLRQRVHYRIGRQNGRIKIEVPLNFRWSGEAGGEVLGRRRLREAITCAQNFYGRYGISVSVINNSAPTNPVVSYSTSIGKSDTSNFHLGENGNHNACSMVAHEVGHWMGLPDRYNSQACPPSPGVQREGGDIMNNGGVYEQEDLHLNAIDFRTILSPLCEGRLVR
ncbi:MAG: hypothetical protein V4598_07910 [Bdellovibrionota bacterium]